MGLKLLHCLFLSTAALLALFVSALGWMALGFGDPASGTLYIFCLPIVLVFLLHPRLGFYAALLYLLANWLLQQFLSYPTLLLNPLAAGINQVLLSSIALLLLAYLLFLRHPKPLTRTIE